MLSFEVRSPGDPWRCHVEGGGESKPLTGQTAALEVTKKEKTRERKREGKTKKKKKERVMASMITALKQMCPRCAFNAHP